ncbi:hypothetical protein [Streptomyces sp. CC228A]|uniref:hypothetical protein n=1 Tax=Streptomyces sp. CC228A TaxID=2898186 RepID=UPI001F391BC3|nr:hypothetical protein [Streptomyces sp. CC228A]
MKKLVEVLGTLLLLSGVCGVVRELTDGEFRFLALTRFLTEGVPFLRGYEIAANVVVAAMGLGMAIAGDRYGRARA